MAEIKASGEFHQRPTGDVYEVQASAAQAYDKLFSRNKHLRVLEKAKVVPVLGWLIDRVQAHALEVGEEAVMETMGYDSKLKLLNRDGLNVRLERKVLDWVENQKTLNDTKSWAFSFLDLNNFKLFNDVLGQTVGDEFLEGFAAALRQSVRFGTGDWVCRHGGEEFVIVNHDEQVDEFSIAHIIENNDNGVVKRVFEGLEKVRKAMANKYKQFNDSSSTLDENKRNMYQHGVGTVSLGTFYYSDIEIYEKYVAFDSQRHSPQGIRSFVDFIFVQEAHRLVKDTVKSLAKTTHTSKGMAVDKAGAHPRIIGPDNLTGKLDTSPGSVVSFDDVLNRQNLP